MSYDSLPPPRGILPALSAILRPPTSTSIPPFLHSPVTTLCLHLSPKSQSSISNLTTSRVKRSRYLREIDRHTILFRIDQGEKQANLAKEYHVSRAAICNLNKNRKQVLSRPSKNPFANHPKQTRMHSLQVSSSSDGEEAMHERCVVVQTMSMRLLITEIMYEMKNVCTMELERKVIRIGRLLMEEAIAQAPMRHVSIVGGCVRGVRAKEPMCVVSLARVMMTEFQYMEPNATCKSVQMKNDGLLESVRIELDGGKSAVHRYVLVLDMVTVTGVTACRVIDELIAKEVLEEKIVLVTMFISPEAVKRVGKEHARVAIVTALVHEKGLRVCKGENGWVDGGFYLSDVVRCLQDTFDYTCMDWRILERGSCIEDR